MAEHEEKDLGAQGTADTLKGKLNQAAGAIQKKAGQVVGNKELEMKGKVREASGEVQSHTGDAERKIDRKLKDDPKH